MSKLAGFLALVALTAVAVGQGAISTPSNDKKLTPLSKYNVLPEISSVSLAFTKDDAVPNLNALPIVSLPIHCIADGTPLFDMINPQAPSEHTFVAIQQNHKVVFSLSAITGVRDIQFWDVFASPSGVTFLVSATNASDQISQTSALSRHFYIATFDSNGTFQTKIQLPLEYQLYHLGALATGEYLVSGYDESANRAFLTLLDSKGDPLKQVSLPVSLQSFDAANDQTQKYPIMAAASSIGSLQFTYYGEGLVVWRTGTNDPLIAIGSHGVVREIRVSYPAGYVLSDIVSSTDSLILHLQQQNEPSSGAHNLFTYPYYQAMAVTGQIVRKLELSGAHPATIACESDGTFVSFQTDDEGKLSLLHAR